MQLFTFIAVWRDKVTDELALRRPIWYVHSNPDLDVDHDMMRYLDLMDIRSRIGDEGFVSPSEEWDGLPRVRCENLERLRRAIDESDV